MKLWVIYNKKHENTIVPKSMQQAAKRNGIDCKIFYFEYFSFEIKNGERKLFYKSKHLKSFPDVAFARGYNSTIRSFLEKQGVKFVNSTTGALTTLDKLETHFVASKFGINQPKTLFGNLTFEEITSKLGKPFVMKSRFGSKGNDVFLVNSKTEFKNLTNQFQNVEFIFQEYIITSKGKDVRLYVVGNDVVGAIERKSTNDDFRSNVSLGAKAELFFGIPLKIKKFANQFAKTLNLHFCSVDFLIGENEFLFCEANANASFKAFFENGLDLVNLVMKYIQTL